jgi:hypothetical protein
MNLELRDVSETFVCAMSNDLETLAHYGPQEGYTLHVPIKLLYHSSLLHRWLTLHQACSPNLRMSLKWKSIRLASRSTISVTTRSASSRLRCKRRIRIL